MKEWQKGEDIEKYLQAKKKKKGKVSFLRKRKSTQEVRFGDLEGNDQG